MKLLELVALANNDAEELFSAPLETFMGEYKKRTGELVESAEQFNLYSTTRIGMVIQNILGKEKNFEIKKSEKMWQVTKSNIGISVHVDEAPTLVKPFGIVGIKIFRGEKSNIFRLVVKPKVYLDFEFINECKKHLLYFEGIVDIHDLNLVKHRKSQLFSIKNFHMKLKFEDISSYLISFNGVDIESSENGIREFLESILDKATCLKD